MVQYLGDWNIDQIVRMHHIPVKKIIDCVRMVTCFIGIYILYQNELRKIYMFKPDCKPYTILPWQVF